MSRLIKKYKNRRLYDTEKSQYITVEDLQRYVVDGILFHVEDARSGEDITNAVLLQILVEMQTVGTYPFLSSEILRHLIIMAHHPLSQSLKALLQEFFSGLQKQTAFNSLSSQYQEASEVWKEQAQQVMGQWEKIFTSKK